MSEDNYTVLYKTAADAYCRVVQAAAKLSESMLHPSGIFCRPCDLPRARKALNAVLDAKAEEIANKRRRAKINRYQAIVNRRGAK